MAKSLGKEKKLAQWRKTLTDNTSRALVSVGPTACQLALVALDSWRKSTPPLREHQLRLSRSPKGTRELGEVLSSLLLAGSISQESAGAPILQTHKAAGRGVLCPTGSFGGYLPSSKDLHPHCTTAAGKPELTYWVWTQAVVVDGPSRHSPTPKSTGTSGDQVKIRSLNPTKRQAAGETLSSLSLVASAESSWGVRTSAAPLPPSGTSGGCRQVLPSPLLFPCQWKLSAKSGLSPCLPAAAGAPHPLN